MPRFHRCVCLLLILLHLSDGTHFRFGTISYRYTADPATDPGRLTFRIKLAFRRSFTGTWGAATIGDSVEASGRFYLGDGSTTYLSLTCTSFNAENDWIFMEGDYLHTYTDTSQIYYPEFRSCCRISNLNNNADASYLVRTKVAWPTTPGLTNESPVASGLPILELQQNSIGTFVIPSADNDASQTPTVEAANGADVIGSASMQWPSWLSVDSHGTVSYNTNGVNLGYWNYAVKISDAYSYIHLDFLIFIKETSRFCECPGGANVACNGENDCSICGNHTSSCEINTAPTFVTASYMHTYQLHNTKRTYADAQQACQADGQNLAKIYSTTDDNNLRLLLDSSHDSYQNAPWIGLSDVAVEGEYRWAEDNTVVAFTNWAANQPNQAGDCVQYYRSVGWNDMPCTTLLPYVCGATVKIPFATPNAGTIAATVIVGYPAQFNVTAQDAQLYQTVTLYPGSMPTGAQLTNIVQSGNTVTGVMTWTPPEGSVASIQTFCFWAQDDRGASSTQHCVQVQVLEVTDPPLPPDTPTLVQALATSLTVSWEMNPNMTMALRQTVSSFKLYDYGSLIYTNTAINVLTFSHTGLSMGTPHSYTVTCCNFVGCSDHSPAGVFSTLNNPFNAPSQVYLIQKAMSSLQVGWNEIYVESGKTFAVWKLTIDDGQPIFIPSTIFNYTATGLSPGTAYTFVVAACETELFCSPGSNPATFSTLTPGELHCATSCPPVSITLSSALLAHYNFNEGTGFTAAAANLASASLDASLSNTTWVPGRYGKALLFTGSEAIVANSSTLDTFPVVDSSLCLWLRRSNLTSLTTLNQTILRKVASTSGPFPFLVELRGTVLTMSISSGSAGSSVVTHLPEDFSWHHVCFVRSVSNSSLAAFQDGSKVVVAADGVSGSIKNEASISIGRGSGGGSDLTGASMDDLMIFSKALSESEVQTVLQGCLTTLQGVTCPACPILGSSPLRDNFQAGGMWELECRDCCARKCDALCFAGGTNPGNCAGADALDAYHRCLGEGYQNGACLVGCNTEAADFGGGGCYANGQVRACSQNCAAVGPNGVGGTCNTWSGECTYPDIYVLEQAASPVNIAAQLILDAGQLVYYNWANWCPAGGSCSGIGTTVLPQGSQLILPSTSGSCGAGYLSQGSSCGNTGATCIDIDECLFAVDNCAPRNALCYNTAGSYYCSCKPGFSEPPLQVYVVGVTASQVLIAPGVQAFTGATHNVTSVPTALTGGFLQQLPYATIPNNTIIALNASVQADAYLGFEVGARNGGFNESLSSAGWVQSGLVLGTACCNLPLWRISVSAGQSLVLPATTTAETVASIIMLRTAVGLADGASCSDTDECLLSSPCDPGATCNNSAGGFTCTCPAGYVGDGKKSGTGCVDIDECFTGTSGCAHNADCINFGGGFNCSCVHGHYGDGFLNGTACTDIDECAIANSTGSSICHSAAYCVNVVGHYDCICNPGYVGGGMAGNDGTPAVCEDINECLVNNGNCSTNAVCVNLPGSHRCDCKPAYEFDAQQVCQRCPHSGTGTALVLDGVNDRLAWVSQNSSLAFSTFTLQAWFYRTGSGISAPVGFNSSAVEPLIVRQYNASMGSEPAYYMGLVSSGATVHLTGGIAKYQITGTQAISDNQWTHIALTFDGTHLRLYRNGLADALPLPAVISNAVAIPSTGNTTADVSWPTCMEAGFCATSSGADQNSGVVQLNDIEGDTTAAQETCLALCRAYSVTWTGCEVAWGSNQRGCYVHTEEVSHGNGAGSYACWVAATCAAGSVQIGSAGGRGAFAGKLREARLDATVLTANAIENSDCPSALRAERDAVFEYDTSSISSNGGCPIGSYCKTWQAPAVCQGYENILCALTTSADTMPSKGSIPAGVWKLLNDPGSATDWPILQRLTSVSASQQLYTYWVRLAYPYQVGPCGSAPSCSISLLQTLPYPTPSFQYLSGLQQSTSGCSFVGPSAQLRLNDEECLKRDHSSNTWQANFGTNYTTSEVWDCQNNMAVQAQNRISQSSYLTCNPSASPATVLGSSDNYAYVQHSTIIT